MSINKKKKLLIVVGGPTASGKTSLAIKLAHFFNTEILSADSRQFYKELNIGVARPSTIELNEVKHHFIACRSINDPYTAGMYARDALMCLNTIFSGKDVAIMVGGSGLFIQAVIEGFHMDNSNNAHRQKSLDLFDTRGIAGLQNTLRDIDPDFFDTIDKSNPQRLMRALERIWATGLQHANQWQHLLEARPFEVFETGIDIDRSELYHHIDNRVDKMMQDGFLDEAVGLLTYRNNNALKTVGYNELFNYLDGGMELAEAVDKIKQNTRRYAKRQMTWCRNKTNTLWHKTEDFEGLLQSIDQKRGATD